MIVEVEMINWRAYDHKSFKFMAGLNFIMGPNGKGKTSILEAISYALTGDVSVVDNPKDLLRDPQKPGTVKLTLAINGKNYLVERTQLPQRAGDASLYDVAENKQLAVHHKNVNSKIEELIGVSSDFLKRIIYMAEGDVFRFLQQPPGKALNQQVYRVLGLTQLDLFKEAIKAAKSKLRDQAKDLKLIQKRIQDLPIKNLSLEDIISGLDEKREIMLKQVLESQDAISRFDSQYQNIFDLRQKIEGNLSFLKESSQYWSALQDKPFLLYFDELQQITAEQQRSLSELEKNLARLKGQQDSSKRVFDLLSLISEGEDDVLCPICKKPMSHAEKLQVVSDVTADISRIEADIAKQERQVASALKTNKQTSQYADRLRELRNLVVHNQINFIQPQMTIQEIVDALSLKEENDHSQNLKDKLRLNRDQLKDIETQRADYVALKSQLEQRSFSDPEDITDALVQIETRQISLDVAAESAEKTLANMRDVQLISIYKQIADVWNNFVKHGKWKLRMDVDGKPLLAEENEREFEFGQFSGGEKTALLVVIHTVIAHYFSGCNFILVDEPLEHLDQVNRRSLMRFFMAASKNNFFEQALVTTYEESLVRKYMSEDNVNILHV